MTVNLSELVMNCTSDVHTKPSEDDMSTIANAIGLVAYADTALRIQIEQKMDLYHKKKISEGEMFNCLVLTDYVSQKSVHFRTQVAELSFITHLQLIGKMKKKHDKTNIVEDKVR